MLGSLYFTKTILRRLFVLPCFFSFINNLVSSSTLHFHRVWVIFLRVKCESFDTSDRRAPVWANSRRRQAWSPTRPAPLGSDVIAQYQQDRYSREQVGMIGRYNCTVPCLASTGATGPVRLQLHNVSSPWTGWRRL